MKDVYAWKTKSTGNTCQILSKSQAAFHRKLLLPLYVKHLLALGFRMA